VIVVGGEALVDLVPSESSGGDPLDVTSHALLPRLGGGPFNVAVAAGRLGAPVRFLSRVSTDAFGDALVTRLASSGVDTALVQRGPEPTTLAVTSMAADRGARYTFYAQGTADRLFTDPGALPGEVTMLCLGTLSLVLEPGASGYEAVLRREAARGVLTALDPNIRAALIADPDAYRVRFASWLPDIGLLKLSIEDAAWLGGGTGDAEDLARGWQRSGPAAVVLTRGARGLAVVTGSGELVESPAVPARVVDTIGAGDTVLGALLAWLYRHGIHDIAAVRAMGTATWHSALKYASAAAAVTVSRAGAEPPFANELRHPI
jgi:fructokinase